MIENCALIQCGQFFGQFEPPVFVFFKKKKFQSLKKIYSVTSAQNDDVVDRCISAGSASAVVLDIDFYASEQYVYNT